MSTLIRLFEAGAEYFHLRKPNSSAEDIRRYIDSIPQVYHSKIVLHQHYDLLDVYDIKGIHFTSQTINQIDKYINSPSSKTVGLTPPSDHKNECKSHKRTDEGVSPTVRDFHKSCSTHSFDEIDDLGHDFDYVFLSPIFDSISKLGYLSNFDEPSLSAYLKTSGRNIVALGGIDSVTASKCADMGFCGVASLGYIWNPALNGDSDKSIDNFKSLTEAYRS
ncbi:MAG: thiamine phosphate synthase [Chlorobi bacterium]|nr:thiamine phosphate synthase [Chlorobiota bacterium]